MKATKAEQLVQRFKPWWKVVFIVAAIVLVSWNLFMIGLIEKQFTTTLLTLKFAFAWQVVAVVILVFGGLALAAYREVFWGLLGMALGMVHAILFRLLVPFLNEVLKEMFKAS